MFRVFENQGNSQEENKLREKYDVPIPSDKDLFGQIAKDKLAREEGCSQTSVGESIREGLIEFWRRNMMNYPPPLSASGRRRKRLREEEAEKERRGTCMRDMREKWRRDWSEFDPSRIFAKDSIAEWFQMAEAKKRGINLKLARIEAKMAQLQAMKALVRELPKFTAQKKCRNNVEKIVDATTKFQWEAIKTLATKAQEVEDKAKSKGKRWRTRAMARRKMWWTTTRAKPI
jgi:hypothetical protein